MLSWPPTELIKELKTGQTFQEGPFHEFLYSIRAYCIGAKPKVTLRENPNYCPLCIPLLGNIPLGGNSLFAACYRMLEEKIIEND